MLNRGNQFPKASGASHVRRVLGRLVRAASNAAGYAGLRPACTMTMTVRVSPSRLSREFALTPGGGPVTAGLLTFVATRLRRVLCQLGSFCAWVSLSLSASAEMDPK